MLNLVNSMSDEDLEKSFTNDDDLFDPESVHYQRSFETDPEELFRKLVSRQNSTISFTVPEKKSMGDKFMCFAKVDAAAAGASDSNLIFTGFGDSAQSARVDCCRNALEYFRIMN